MKYLVFSLMCFAFKGEKKSNKYDRLLNAKIKEHAIDSVVVYKAEFGIEMSSAVCCEEIFRNFIVEKHVIQSKDSISTIVSDLSKVTKMKDWDTCVDSRAVIKMYARGSIINTTCIGQLSIIRINNEIVELNDRHLINYIFKLKD